MKFKIISLVLVILSIFSIRNTYGKYIDEKIIDLANINIQKQYYLTVKYIDKYNNKTIKETYQYLYKESNYTTEQLEFDNYVYEDNSGNTEGIIMDDTEVKYYYVKEGVYAKLYDTNSDSIGDTLVLNNVPKFEYNIGNLTCDYDNSDSSSLDSPIWFNDRTYIEKIEILNEIKPTKTKQWFYECSKLTSINGIEKINTSKDTNMSHMFYKCSSITNLDLSTWNTSNVKTMIYMFYECRKLQTLKIDNFDTQNVLSMGYMFYYCKNLKSLDLSKFNMEKVESVVYMFGKCFKLETVDVSNWKTSSLNNIQGVFCYCYEIRNLDLSSWDTSKVTEMNYAFADCVNIQKIYVSNKYVTNKVVKSENMFRLCDNIVGNNGTTFDNTKTDIEYARIDTPQTPGYFSKING